MFYRARDIDIDITLAFDWISASFVSLTVTPLISYTSLDFSLNLPGLGKNNFFSFILENTFCSI